MTMFLYSATSGPDFMQVRHLLDKVAGGSDLEVHQSVDSLNQRLLKPVDRPAVAVLMLADAEEINSLEALGPLLDDIRLVLILPPNNGLTPKSAHRLLPRYVTYAGGDYLDLEAVLTKMAGQRTPAERTMNDEIGHA